MEKMFADLKRTEIEAYFGMTSLTNHHANVAAVRSLIAHSCDSSVVIVTSIRIIMITIS